jgi:hypothetical protein
LSGSRDLGGWNLSYDAYAGNMAIDKFNAPEQFLRGQPVSAEVQIEKSRNVLGGRLVLQTPVDGLSFGSSAFTGKVHGRREHTVAGHAEYTNDTLVIRAEYAREREPDLFARGWYVETSYRFTPKWQVAALYDFTRNNFIGVSNPVAPSLLRHSETALGLNYWFSREWVLKLDVHRVNGNRCAGPPPEDYGRLVAAGALNPRTNLVKFGVNFSF